MEDKSLEAWDVNNQEEPTNGVFAIPENWKERREKIRKKLQEKVEKQLVI